MVVYFAADLLWATRIKATADALAIPCRPVRSPDMLRARLADSDVKGLIVDLETADQGLQLIHALRETPPANPVTIVAFGPHVAVELLDQARRAGADRVLARGAFDRQLPDILRDLEGTPAEPPQ